jgi:heme a synthase
MMGNIFYEHSHRLVASGVGLLTIALALSLWWQERRKWLRWLGVTALVLVVIQGVLGGMRVVLLEHSLAIVHASMAQAFFALAVSLALFTSAEWREEVTDRPLADSNRLRRLAAVTTGVIYVQVFFGAVLRHTGLRLDAHLLFAALVMLHVLLLVIRIMNSHSDNSRLTRPAVFLTAMLIVQVFLGTVSYFAKFTTLLRMPVDATVIFTTTHLVIGALMLVTSLVLTLRSYRIPTVAKPVRGQKVLAEQYSL